MKKVLLILGLVFTVSIVFSQNYQLRDLSKTIKTVKKDAKSLKSTRGTGINNSDFETWVTTGQMYGLGEWPDGWSMITGNPSGQKLTGADVQNGSYAIHCQSDTISNAALGWTDTLIGGQAITANLLSGVVGEPYTQRPDSMTFHIKGSLSGNDTAIVVLQLMNTGNLVGSAGAYLGSGDITSTYQEFTVPFNYENSNTPDSAMAIISSSGVGVFQGSDVGTLTAGSFIDVDNISFSFSSNPVAAVNPMLWDAGSVDVGNTNTSGNIQLSNSGAGTLTVSNVTDLSATPFSTSFNAGTVSLGSGQTYDFTFSFDPTAAGTYNETFTIETNGGNVDIDLSGIATTPVTGDMGGGFETNVNDFDTTFSGWTQHDLDGSTTYGFNSISFPNSGYTGSFIAFNPAQTSPAMTAPAIQPNTGDRFGACFAATSGPNDDWLITPLSDTLNSGASLNMMVKSYTDQYGLERYTVNVSTTGTNPGDFTKISSGNYLTADTVWTADNHDLSAYAGQQVYVGIHCVSDDAFIFMVDDIEIDNPTNVSDNQDPKVAVYPNPANDVVFVRNAENSNITVVNMVGQVVLSKTADNKQETINVSELPGGTYIIRVEKENEVSVEKLNILK